MVLRLDGDKIEGGALGLVFSLLSNFWFLRNSLWVGMAGPGSGAICPRLRPAFADPKAQPSFFSGPCVGL